MRLVGGWPGILVCDEMVVIDARNGQVKVSGPMTPQLGAVIAAVKQALGPSQVKSNLGK